MITISQLSVEAGQPEKNTEKLLQDIETAKQKGSDLHIATELVVPGYLVGDEWENEAFVRASEAQNEAIIDATRDSNMTVIWGNILTDPTKRNEDGRIRKYNAAFVARNGVLEGRTIKTLMPNYREFEDKRHFTSLKDLAFEEGASLADIGRYFQPFDIVIEGIKRRVGLIICEDMWDDDYILKPAELLRTNGADMIVNISASPFGMGKDRKRDRLLSRQSAWMDFVYVNHIGAQNNSKNQYVFDGASTLYRDGRKAFGTRAFQEGFIEVKEGQVETGKTEMEKIEEALVYGIREYVRTSGLRKLVIGLSGGVDSALVAALAVEAIWKENIIAINMPSVYNSDTTKELAKELAKELGISYSVIPIQESVDFTKAQIQSILGVSITGLMDENIQARDRGSRVLMAVAAEPGCMLTNNGNKLEMATGYASIAGDLNGALAPIADLYKTQIFTLSRMMSEKYRLPALAKICDIPPSAELSAEQAVEEGKWDPFFFPYHDRLMYQFLEMRKDPEDILRAYRSWNLTKILNSWTYEVGDEYALKPTIIGPDGYFPSIEAWISDIERIWKLFRGSSIIKGKYVPTIVSISRRALGYDLRRSETGAYFTPEYERLKQAILN